MIITQQLLDNLTEEAKRSERLRINLDLRNTPKDQSQRMLNAIEPGSVVPIHRHCKTSETIVCLRGRILAELYDDCGQLIEAVELMPNGLSVAFNVPIGMWHTAKALDVGTVILEVKDGAYEPMKDQDILQNP